MDDDYSPLVPIKQKREKPRSEKRYYGATFDRDRMLLPIDTPEGSSVGSQSDVSEKSNAHCHEAFVRSTDSNARARKTLIIVSIFCLIFMTAEVIGGYIAGSLAIMTDAAHLLSDFASFMISLVSLFLASRPATRRMSYGWHRAEVLGAVISVLMIWLLTGILVYVAIERIIYKNYDIRADIMLITAFIGVVVNVIMGVILHQSGHGHSHGGGGGGHGHSHGGSNHGHGHGHSHKSDGHSHGEHGETRSLQGPKKKSGQNINVRAALIHVIGDLIQSVGILTAAFVIYYRPDLAVLDPICTFLFSVLVLFTTTNVMRDALTVLMEGIPRGINFMEVNEALLSVYGVKKAHDLRIWSLTLDKTALSVHLAVDATQNTQEILRQTTQLLRDRFQVYECTVQIEHYIDAMDECKSCEAPIK